MKSVMKLFLSNKSDVDSKMENLRRKLNMLTARATDIKNELQNAETLQGKKRKCQVECWLKEVERLKVEVESIEQGLKSSNSQLYDRIEKTTKEVEEQLQSGNFCNGLVLEDYDSNNPPLVETTVVGGRFQEYFGKILEWLSSPKPNPIGVYGMGGVGKTTLLKRINNHLRGHKDIAGCVYWITVSKDCELFQLQQKIAKALGVGEIEKEDVGMRAAILHDRITKMGKIVLILDDMWIAYNRDRVGIHGCNIILSTRKVDVCRRMNCADLILQVQTLHREESWKLFLQTLDNQTAMESKVEEIAKEVARECKCLPLAIITVAGSMRGIFDVCEWKNALDELRSPDRMQCDMENDVYPLLRFSYDHLNDKITKRCFLTCALYGEDEWIKREELIQLWMWEGLLKDAGGTEEQSNKGHTILNNLQNSCLLDKVDKRFEKGKEYVKMHDLIRDMAIFITQGEPHFIAKAGQQLREVPEEKYWTEDLINVSLSENDIQEVPDNMSPNCPKLTLLMLRNSWDLKRIPDRFFVHMKALTVLDLSFAESIKSVPESVSNLENLKALLLCYCMFLKYVPSVARLTKLQVLDFWGSVSIIAPKGMECLEQLEKFEYCRWGISELRDFNRMINSLQFSRLSMYKFDILPPNYDYGDLRLKWFPRRGIFIAGLQYREELSELSIPDTVKSLYFFDCDFECRNLGEVLPTIDCVTELEGLQLIRCRRLEYVVGAPHGHFSSHLDKLELKRLPNLKRIVKEERIETMFKFASLTPLPFTFAFLTDLIIEGCPKLEVVFPAELLLQPPVLPYLVSLKVIDCEELVEIFEFHGNNLPLSFSLSFPKMKYSTLRNLPKLECIHRGLLIFSLDIVTVSIEDCPNLELLPLSRTLLCDNSASSLSSIPRCADNPEWWEDFRKQYPLDADILSDLVSIAHDHVLNRKTNKEMSVVGVDFKGPPVTMPDILEALSIEECDFEWRNVGVAFPGFLFKRNLKQLSLNGCRRLVSVGWAPLPSTTFSHLKSIALNDCPNVKVVFPVELQLRQLVLPNLTHIAVKNCEEVEEIFESSLGCSFVLSLPQLRHITLNYLPKLRCIYRGLLISHDDCCEEIIYCPMLKLVLVSSTLYCDESVANLTSVQSYEDDPDWWDDLFCRYPETPLNVICDMVREAHILHKRNKEWGGFLALSSQDYHEESL